MTDDALHRIISTDIVPLRIFNLVQRHCVNGTLDDAIRNTSLVRDIRDILQDPYAHLSEDQRGLIREEVIKILMTGNGIDEGMNHTDAHETAYGMTLTEIFNWDAEIDWIDRLGFDPETGVSVENPDV